MFSSLNTTKPNAGFVETGLFVCLFLSDIMVVCNRKIYEALF